MPNKKIIFRKTMGETDEFDPIPMVWVRQFDFEYAAAFAKQIAEYEADTSVKEIFMYVSSYGGEVMPLLTMLDAMLACSKPIHSIVMGAAASCGAILSVAAPGKRFIGDLSTIHIHHIRAMLYEDLPGIEQEAKTLNRIEAKLFKAMAKRSNTTMTAIKKKLKEENREWNLSSEEALEWGFVDFIKIPKLTAGVFVECEY